MKRFFILGMFSLICSAVQAQDSLILLEKNFQFTDGIYFSLEDFQTNQPSLVWEEVEGMVHSNPQNFMAQVQYLKVKEKTESPYIHVDKIWGICLGGIPYVRLEKEWLDKPLVAFAGLRLRGKICYFNYEEEVDRKVDMPVYNPVSKRVFRRMTVDRKQTVVHEKMLHFETGKIEDFTPANFIEWIADDQRLVKTLTAMSASEQQEKLFKCLLIYADRNEVMIEGN